MSLISLCIPRVFNNITKDKVYDVFTQLNLGQIHSIDIVEQTNKKKERVKRVFIHFSDWFMNNNAQIVFEKLMQGKEIKIVYDDPWFWKVAVNKSKQGSIQNKHKQYEFIQYEREQYEREQYERKQYEQRQYEQRQYEQRQYEREQYEREQYERRQREQRKQYVNIDVKPTTLTNIATGIIDIKPTQIAPALNIDKFIRDIIVEEGEIVEVEREDNPNIYADDLKLMERMKPIDYSKINIPVPKKKLLKIKK